MNPLDIINKYYTAGSPQWEILVGHSRAVADYAAEIIARHPEPDVDAQFVYEAAMLHDIGICRTDAPSIFCTGTHHYICHGYLGSAMMQAENLPRHARVCERHTGAGLTVADIVERDLPLPHRDMLPETLEERIVCYADKFYSKSGDVTRRKTLDQAVASLAKHGSSQTERFMAMHRLLGI